MGFRIPGTLVTGLVLVIGLVIFHWLERKRPMRREYRPGPGASWLHLRLDRADYQWSVPVIAIQDRRILYRDQHADDAHGAGRLALAGTVCSIPGGE
jgi:hypothetical protein